MIPAMGERTWLVPRAQRVRELRRLLALGFTASQAARQMGISLSYVRALRSDPSGKKDRDRKRSYGGTCERCGRTTDGSNGRSKAPQLCISCSRIRQGEEAHWTQELILHRIREWHRLFGRPPLSTEWLLRTSGYVSDNLDEEGFVYWPNTGTVLNLFGTWANAIEAAGFPRPPRAYVRPHGWWTRERCLEAVREWELQHNELPSSSEWHKKDATGGRPSTSTCAMVFGSWKSMLAEYGKVPVA